MRLTDEQLAKYRDWKDPDSVGTGSVVTDPLVSVGKGLSKLGTNLVAGGAYLASEGANILLPEKYEIDLNKKLYDAGFRADKVDEWWDDKYSQATREQREDIQAARGFGKRALSYLTKPLGTLSYTGEMAGENLPMLVAPGMTLSKTAKVLGDKVAAGEISAEAARRYMQRNASKLAVSSGTTMEGLQAGLADSQTIGEYNLSQGDPYSKNQDKAILSGLITKGISQFSTPWAEAQAARAVQKMATNKADIAAKKPVSFFDLAKDMTKGGAVEVGLDELPQNLFSTGITNFATGRHWLEGQEEGAADSMLAFGPGSFGAGARHLAQRPQSQQTQQTEPQQPEEPVATHEALSQEEAPEGAYGATQQDLARPFKGYTQQYYLDQPQTAIPVAPKSPYAYDPQTEELTEPARIQAPQSTAGRPDNGPFRADSDYALRESGTVNAQDPQKSQKSQTGWAADGAYYDVPDSVGPERPLDREGAVKDGQTITDKPRNNRVNFAPQNNREASPYVIQDDKSRKTPNYAPESASEEPDATPRNYMAAQNFKGGKNQTRESQVWRAPEFPHQTSEGMDVEINDPNKMYDVTFEGDEKGKEGKAQEAPKLTDEQKAENKKVFESNLGDNTQLTHEWADHTSWVKKELESDNLTSEKAKLLGKWGQAAIETGEKAEAGPTAWEEVQKALGNDPAQWAEKAKQAAEKARSYAETRDKKSDVAKFERKAEIFEVLSGLLANDETTIQDLQLIKKEKIESQQAILTEQQKLEEIRKKNEKDAADASKLRQDQWDKAVKARREQEDLNIAQRKTMEEKIAEIKELAKNGTISEEAADKLEKKYRTGGAVDMDAKRWKELHKEVQDTIKKETSAKAIQDQKDTVDAKSAEADEAYKKGTISEAHYKKFKSELKQMLKSSRDIGGWKNLNTAVANKLRKYKNQTLAIKAGKEKAKGEIAKAKALRDQGLITENDFADYLSDYNRKIDEASEPDSELKWPTIHNSQLALLQERQKNKRAADAAARKEAARIAREEARAKKAEDEAKAKAEAQAAKAAAKAQTVEASEEESDPVEARISKMRFPPHIEPLRGELKDFDSDLREYGSVDILRTRLERIKSINESLEAGKISEEQAQKLKTEAKTELLDRYASDLRGRLKSHLKNAEKAFAQQKAKAEEDRRLAERRHLAYGYREWFQAHVIPGLKDRSELDSIHKLFTDISRHPEKIIEHGKRYHQVTEEMAADYAKNLDEEGKPFVKKEVEKEVQDNTKSTEGNSQGTNISEEAHGDQAERAAKEENFQATLNKIEELLNLPAAKSTLKDEHRTRSEWLKEARERGWNEEDQKTADLINTVLEQKLKDVKELKYYPDSKPEGLHGPYKSIQDLLDTLRDSVDRLTGKTPSSARHVKAERRAWARGDYDADLNQLKKFTKEVFGESFAADAAKVINFWENDEIQGRLYQEYQRDQESIGRGETPSLPSSHQSEELRNQLANVPKYKAVLEDKSYKWERVTSTKRAIQRELAILQDASKPEEERVKAGKAIDNRITIRKTALARLRQELHDKYTNKYSTAQNPEPLTETKSTWNGEQQEGTVEGDNIVPENTPEPQAWRDKETRFQKPKEDGGNLVLNKTKKPRTYHSSGTEAESRDTPRNYAGEANDFENTVQWNVPKTKEEAPAKQETPKPTEEPQKPAKPRKLSKSEKDERTEAYGLALSNANTAVSNMEASLRNFNDLSDADKQHLRDWADGEKGANKLLDTIQKGIADAEKIGLTDSQKERGLEAQKKLTEMQAKVREALAKKPAEDTDELAKIKEYADQGLTVLANNLTPLRNTLETAKKNRTKDERRNLKTIAEEGGLFEQAIQNVKKGLEKGTFTNGMKRTTANFAVPEAEKLLEQARKEYPQRTKKTKNYQASVAENPPAQGMSKAQFVKESEKVFGRGIIRDLEASGKVVIVNSQEELFSQMAKDNSRVLGGTAEEHRADIESELAGDNKFHGIYDGISGKTYINLEHVAPGQAAGILTHEIGVHAARDSKFRKLVEPMMSRARELYRQGMAQGNPFWKRVEKRMIDAGESNSEELLAYAVQQYTEDHGKARIPQKIREFIEDVIYKIGRWLKGEQWHPSNMEIRELAGTAQELVKAYAKESVSENAKQDQAVDDIMALFPPKPKKAAVVPKAQLQQANSQNKVSPVTAFAQAHPDIATYGKAASAVITEALQKLENYFLLTTDALVRKAKDAGIDASKYMKRVANRNELREQIDARNVEVGDRWKNSKHAIELSKFLSDSTLQGKWGFAPDWLETFDKKTGQRVKLSVKVDPAFEAEFKKFSPEDQQIIKDVFKTAYDNRKELIEQSWGYLIRETEALRAAETDPAEQARLDKELADLKGRFRKEFKNIAIPYTSHRRYGSHVVIYKSDDLAHAEEIVQAALEARDDFLARNTRPDKNDPAYPTWLAGWKKVQDAYQNAVNAEDNMRGNQDHYIVSMHDGIGEATIVGEQLKKIYAGKGRILVQERRSEDAQGMMTSKAMSGAIQAMRSRLVKDKNGQLTAKSLAAQEAIKILQDAYTQVIAREGFEATLNRQGVAGWTEKLWIPFANQGHSMASAIANAKYAKQIGDEITSIEKQATRLGTPEARRYYNEFHKRYMEDIKPYVPSKAADIVDTVRAATTVTTLTTKPVFYLQNSLQPAQMTLPVLAGEFGLKPAMVEMNTAALDVMKLAFKPGKLLQNVLNFLKDADERRFLQQMADEKQLDIGRQTEFGRFSGTGKISQALQKADDFFSSAMQNVEVLNRVTAGLASYRLMKRKLMADGMNAKDAHIKATDYGYTNLQFTQGDYSKTNAPRFFNTGVGRVMGQFRKFQAIQYCYLTGLFHRAFKDADPDVRKVGKAQLLYASFLYGALGGVKAMPFFAAASALMGAAQSMFGDDDEDLEAFFRRKGVALGLSKEVVDVIANGIPAIFGMELAPYLGAQDALSIYSYADPKVEKDNPVLAAVGALAGPSVGKLISAGKGWKKGDVRETVSPFLPRFAADAWKVADRASNGYGFGSTKLFTAKDFGTAEGVWALLQTAAGMNPKMMSDAYLKRHALRAVEEGANKAFGKMKEEYLEAKRNRDYRKQAEIRQKWSNYLKYRQEEFGEDKKAHPVSQLEAYVKNANKLQSKTKNGVRVEKKQERYANSF